MVQMNLLRHGHKILLKLNAKKKLEEQKLKEFLDLELEVITNSNDYAHDMTCVLDYRVGDCMWTEAKCLKCRILKERYKRSIS